MHVIYTFDEPIIRSIQRWWPEAELGGYAKPLGVRILLAQPKYLNIGTPCREFHVGYLPYIYNET